MSYNLDITGGMNSSIHDHRILVIDFGSQYTQLIARRIREAGVYCELAGPEISDAGIKSFNPKGIILSGGPESATVGKTPAPPHKIFTADIPVLGICYGMQIMAVQLGGQVESAKRREFGYAQIRTHGDSALLSDITDYKSQEEGNLLDVWMSHGDRVAKIPQGFKVIASTDNAPFAGMADEKRRFYGLQFHPEVTHTKQGKLIFERFITKICACKTRWTPAHIIDDSIMNIRQRIGSDQVLLGLSGGVDSSVVAALLHRAIGEKLTCVFIDNGLLRQHEGDEIMSMFAKHMGIKVIRVDAEHTFLNALAGEHDPENKRRIIGQVFIDLFEQQANKINDVKWLAQGTIYPDVIESAAAKTGKAQVIKTHHNVGGLPDYMRLKLLEPLRELFKDEVRKLGIELGLPHDIVYRHPFPGPGLSVRILGEVKKEYADLLRQADYIFIDELKKHDLYQQTSQAFAVFLPVKSVGVIGDNRCYSYVISLRAIETIDFMTARWAQLPYDFLDRVSNRIINEVVGISRVTYDISGKPPATIEWE